MKTIKYTPPIVKIPPFNITMIESVDEAIKQHGEEFVVKAVNFYHKIKETQSRAIEREHREAQSAKSN